MASGENQPRVCDYLSGEDVQSVFKFLRPEDVEKLCDYLEYRECPSGMVLMKEGETGDYMGFLVNGRLEIKKETSFPGKYITVAVLDRGTMVGEMAIVQPQARSATVWARENSQLLILSQESMERLIEAHPRLGIKLLKRILHILSLRLKNAGERLSWLL